MHRNTQRHKDDKGNQVAKEGRGRRLRGPLGSED